MRIWDWIRDEDNRGALATIGTAIAAIVAAGWAVFVYVGDRVPAPEPPKADILNINVDSVTLQFDAQGKAKVYSRVNVGNTGAEGLLIKQVTLALGATSTKDGSHLSKAITLAEDVSVEPNTVTQLPMGWIPVGQWEQLLKPTNQLPRPNTHFFEFTLQVQAVTSSGKEIWADIQVPQPVPMTCDTPCLATFALKVKAGASSYKECIAHYGGAEWSLDCRSRDNANR